jgi:hypothetical protein
VGQRPTPVWPQIWYLADLIMMPLPLVLLLLPSPVYYTHQVKTCAERCLNSRHKSSLQPAAGSTRLGPSQAALLSKLSCRCRCCCCHVHVLCCCASLGEDVCREVSEVASQVIIAARSWENPDWGRDPRPFGPVFGCLADSSIMLLLLLPSPVVTYFRRACVPGGV